MSKSLKLNKIPGSLYSLNGQQTEVKTIIIDFSPHLITYLLTQIKQSHGVQQIDLAYALAYKLLKTFDQNNQTLYSPICDLSQAIALPFAQFILDSQSYNEFDFPLYEESENLKAQKVYVDLVLVNVLMQEPSGKCSNWMKIKGSKLGLSQ